MLFKDLKQGYPVYILDTQEMSFTQGKATQVSFPHTEINKITGRSEMLVDVTIEANGKTATYAIPDNASITNAGHLTLSTDKKSLVNDVEAQVSNANQAIAAAEKAKEIIEKAPALLAQLDPTVKEKQESEKRLSDMEKAMVAISRNMEKQGQAIDALIKKLGK